MPQPLAVRGALGGSWHTRVSHPLGRRDDFHAGACGNAAAMRAFHPHRHGRAARSRCLAIPIHQVQREVRIMGIVLMLIVTVAAIHMVH
jgi:hypothetical protein